MCGLKNIFSCMTIKLYSPTTYAVSELMFAPLLMIYYYIRYEERKDLIPHIIINFFLSIINFFFSCVYNELLILNFCKLEYSTYPEIARRASEKSKIEDSQNYFFNDSSYELDLLAIN